MTGVKGRSGRKPNPKYNHPYFVERRIRDLELYYKNREEALIQRRQYHKKIKDYSVEHEISFEEARKALAKERKK